MNKRLKELAEKAGFTYLNEQAGFGACHQLALQQFAELIVQDCANECRKVSYAAMEIPLPQLNERQEIRDFERGYKSGRKFGAMDCFKSIFNKFGLDK